MKIRTRLTLQFSTLVATIVTISLLSIYFFSSEYRTREFYTRLKNKVITTARLLNHVTDANRKFMSIMEGKETTILIDKSIVAIDNKGGKLYEYYVSKPIHLDSSLITRIKKEKEVRFFDGNYQFLGIHYISAQDGLECIVLASAIDEMGYAKLSNLRLILFSVFFLNIVLVIIAGWRFSGQALSPISSVIKQVDNISPNNLSQRVLEGNGKDEIAQLARTFNNMLQRIETAFNVQKMFVANASHELRTPLTSLTGQIEVTLLKERALEEYQQTLHSLLEDIRSLTILANRLLSLAKVSSDLQATHMEPIRVDEMLWQVRAELIQAFPEYHIKINFNNDFAEEKSLIANANDTLLKTVFINLMENACKFSDDNTVECSIDSVEGHIVISFKDRGRGISKQELRNIFSPFFRGSNVIDIKGHGLGLSLVDRIVRQLNGRIIVNSELNKGTTFTVFLPMALD